MKTNLRASLVAEFLGTAFLVAAVVGSGIMADRLSGGNVALALLANTVATGAALVALICAFGPVSGAHLNPVVSLADALEGHMERSEALPYILAQLSGGISGTIDRKGILRTKTVGFEFTETFEKEVKSLLEP